MAVLRDGITDLVIDPWNEVEHTRAANMTETEYVGKCLQRFKAFGLRHGCNVWIVAHPAKPTPQKGAEAKSAVPGPYDIAGSAHWYNKADNILCVYRDPVDGGQDVEIHVQKVRFKHIGKVGSVILKYDRVTGTYFEMAGPALRSLTGTPELYADPARRE